VGSDPVKNDMQRWVFLQPVTCLRVFDAEIIDDLFVGDGGEFLHTSGQISLYPDAGAAIGQYHS
jgi:hypothetical protein